MKNSQCVKLFSILSSQAVTAVHYLYHEFIVEHKLMTQAASKDRHNNQSNINTSYYNLKNILVLILIFNFRPPNPGIFTSILFIPPSIIHKNLLLSYSTQSSQAAYEMIELETSRTIDNEVTYEIKTGDTDRIIPMASQYVNALYTRLEEDLDVSSLLDMVHAGMYIWKEFIMNIVQCRCGGIISQSIVLSFKGA